jgi:hypothetical protein
VDAADWGSMKAGMNIRQIEGRMYSLALYTGDLELMMALGTFSDCVRHLQTIHPSYFEAGYRALISLRDA